MGVPCMVGMTPELGPCMGLALNKQTDVTKNNTSLVGDNNFSLSLQITACPVLFSWALSTQVCVR